jgi:hypothetical protein
MPRLKVEVDVSAAPTIKDDSWLWQPEHEWYCHAHMYASNQTQAIPALASCSPEQMFHAFEALRIGAELYSLKRIHESFKDNSKGKKGGKRAKDEDGA